MAMISKTAQPGGCDWDDRLPYVLFSYRCCEQASTLESPFFMLYGRDPVLPTEEFLSKTPDQCYVKYDDYQSQLARGSLGPTTKECGKSTKTTKEAT